MSECCINLNEEQEQFEKPTEQRLAGLGVGCFVQIHRNGQYQWIEITRTEGDELIGKLHSALSTPLPNTTSEAPNSTDGENQASNEEVRLRKEDVSALGCERYCDC